MHSDLKACIRERLQAGFENPALNKDRFAAAVQAESGRLRAAAVLIALVEHPDELTVLLTRRSEHLKHHAGQISFPGGAVEPQDRGPVQTALRETEEEIGLPGQAVDVAGLMGNYQTGTGFLVTPVVGFVHPPLRLAPDPFEVADVFEVPLSHVLEPKNHQRDSRIYRGKRRHFYVIPYRHYHIWGATAAMLVMLAELLPRLNCKKMA